PTKSSICFICTSTVGRYTCPKCGIAYCSVACYRHERHSACSEAFYRDCCLESLRGETVGTSERRAMAEVLRRRLAQEAEEKLMVDDVIEDEEDDLASRLAGVDLDAVDIDADALWRQLTPSERRRFVRSLETGECADCLPEVTPWWQGPVRDAEKEPPTLSAPDAALVASLRPDPASTTRRLPPPSPLMPLVLLEALLTYAYSMRLSNCDLTDCPDQLITCCQLLWPCAPGSKSSAHASTPTSSAHAPTPTSSAHAPTPTSSAHALTPNSAPAAIAQCPSNAPLPNLDLTVARFLHRLQSNPSQLCYSNSLFLACLHDAIRLLGQDRSLRYPERALADLHSALQVLANKTRYARLATKRLEYLCAWLLAEESSRYQQCCQLVPLLELAVCQYATELMSEKNTID
ncbi:hypothetical protein BOX15_Mlig029957g1, partial [Macrostomum lignano]